MLEEILDTYKRRVEELEAKVAELQQEVDALRCLQYVEPVTDGYIPFTHDESKEMGCSWLDREGSYHIDASGRGYTVFGSAIGEAKDFNG